MFVNFSSSFRGNSTFFTSDEQLAEKIRAHRWFREGRIQEIVIESTPQDETKAEAAAQTTTKTEVKYSITGKRFVRTTATIPTTPADDDKGEETTPDTTESPDETTNEEQKVELNPDDVTTFMEAKEYLIEAYGIKRSTIRTKDAMAEVCKEKGITFKNYDLDV
jgi:hypothetical protein